MAYKIPDEAPPTDEPDLRGWSADDVSAEYYEIDVSHLCEPYNPDKDPVNKGLVPDPYAGKAPEDGGR